VFDAVVGPYTTAENKLAGPVATGAVTTKVRNGVCAHEADRVGTKGPVAKGVVRACP